MTLAVEKRQPEYAHAFYWAPLPHRSRHAVGLTIIDNVLELALPLLFTIVTTAMFVRSVWLLVSAVESRSWPSVPGVIVDAALAEQPQGDGGVAVGARMTRVAVALLTLVLAGALHADTWSPATTRTFYSSDGTWRLVVEPRRIDPLDYFTRKVEGAEVGPRHGGPRATLSRKGSFGRWRRVHRWPLVNDVSPVDALVANDGTVVTFDNWHLMGDGDDVVVIYRPDGTLIRKLALEDVIEPDDIEHLDRSVSSIHWSGRHRIDETNRLLVLQVRLRGTQEVPLHLDTGELRDGRRSFYDPPRVTTSYLKLGPGRCAPGSALVTIEELAPYAPPPYPEMARRAWIGGTVILEFDVDASGKAANIKVLKPLPLGMDQAAVEALRTWQFPRAEACGQVEFRFKGM